MSAYLLKDISLLLWLPAVTPLDSVLERQPQTKLQLAHRGSRRDHAKGCRRGAGRNRVTRLSEVHHVEGIRTIDPEAQPEALTQTEVPRERQINDLIARSIKEVSRRVAIGGDAGYDLVLYKGRGVEPLRRGPIANVRIAD